MTKSLQECENDLDMLFLELERIQQRIESISDERIKDSEMIAQILNQMQAPTRIRLTILNT